MSRDHTNNEDTLLQRAFYANQVKKVRELIEMGESKAVKNTSGRDLLYIAANQHNVEMAKLLLSFGGGDEARPHSITELVELMNDSFDKKIKSLGKIVRPFLSAYQSLFVQGGVYEDILEIRSALSRSLLAEQDNGESILSAFISLSDDKNVTDEKKEGIIFDKLSQFLSIEEQVVLKVQSLSNNSLQLKSLGVYLSGLPKAELSKKIIEFEKEGIFTATLSRCDEGVKENVAERLASILARGNEARKQEGAAEECADPLVLQGEEASGVGIDKKKGTNLVSGTCVRVVDDVLKNRAASVIQPLARGYLARLTSADNVKRSDTLSM